MILRFNYSLNIISCKEETRMRKFLRKKLKNDVEMGWIVPWHASSIYSGKHLSTPPFETNVFYQTKLMNQSNDSSKQHNHN